MAIKEIKGNLIGLVETGVLDGMAHGCNCMHAMGSGIAGQLARRYPAVPNLDRTETKCGDRSKLGGFTVGSFESLVQDVYFNVFNLYTQYAPSYDGSDVFEYDLFPAQLQQMKLEIEDWCIFDEDDCEDWNYKLGIPKIGAGLAGGDWDRIRDMIIDAFNSHPNIIIYLVDWDGTDLPAQPQQSEFVNF